MNRTSLVEVFNGKDVMYFIFTICGIFAIVTNSIVVFIYTSTTALRKTYLVIAALALADLLNGLSFAINGVYRLVQFDTVTYKPKFRYLDCVLMPWPALKVIGSQWPAMLTFCLGFERFLAVRFPFVYISSHDRRQSIIVITTVVLVVISLILAHIYPIIIARNWPSYYLCTLWLTFGKIYSEAIYIITIIAHALGCLFSAIAYYMAKASANKPGTNNSFRKELTRARMILLLSLLSVIFVVVPNILLMIATALKIRVTILIGYIYCLFCIRSSLNILVFGAFNVDFRSQLLKMLRLKKGSLWISSVQVGSSIAINRNRPQSHIAEINKPFQKAQRHC